MQNLCCQAVLIDLDGTLVDSSAVVERHWGRWANENGFDPDEVVAVAHGRRPVDTVRTLLPTVSNPQDIADGIVAGESSDAEGLRTIAGAPEFIAALPDGRWTIATSGPRPIATFRLRMAQIPIPHTLVTAEDVALGKPDPAPYALAAQRLGFAASDCVVLEDTPAGIQSGRAAGAQVIGIATNNPPDVLLSAGAVFVITDFVGARAILEHDQLCLSMTSVAP